MLACSVDPGEMLHMQHLIRVYSVFHDIGHLVRLFVNLGTYYQDLEDLNVICNMIIRLILYGSCRIDANRTIFCMLMLRFALL